MCPSAVARWVLPTPTGPRTRTPCAGLGEPQAGQVREQGPVVGEVVGLVPGVQPHGRVQAGGAGAQHRRAGLAAGDLVGQEQLEERGVAHLALPGQREPLGQGVLEPAELERLQRPASGRRRPGRSARLCVVVVVLVVVIGGLRVVVAGAGAAWPQRRRG